MPERIAFVDHMMVHETHDTVPGDGQGNAKVANTETRTMTTPHASIQQNKSVPHNSKNTFTMKTHLQRNTHLWKLHPWKRAHQLQNIGTSKATQRFWMRSVWNLCQHHTSWMPHPWKWKCQFQNHQIQQICGRNAMVMLHKCQRSIGHVVNVQSVQPSSSPVVL